MKDATPTMSEAMEGLKLRPDFLLQPIGVFFDHCRPGGERSKGVQGFAEGFIDPAKRLAG